jgi:hypothetical protein
MPPLTHYIIYRKDHSAQEDEWRRVQYNPLTIDGAAIAAEDCVEMHDDVIRYFNHFFCGIHLYNPARKAPANGFYYGGATVIKKEHIPALIAVIDPILSLCENTFSQTVTLTGDYCKRDKRYQKIPIDNDKLTAMFTRFKVLSGNVLNHGGYILHCAI